MSGPLKVLLVDDEPIVLRDLERLLAKMDDLEVVGTAGDGLSALTMIDRLRPDLVFLDIQMPELDGLAIVEALDEQSPPLVVFVTAYDRYAIRAFDTDAVDYLLKPFDADRLDRALERVRERLRSRADRGVDRLVEALVAAGGSRQRRWPERLAVRARGKAVVVELAQVRWIEAAGNYARLHLPDRSYLTRRTMRDLEATLDPAVFVRAHRSHIVALPHVRELRALGDGDHEITLDTGVRLVVTRAYRERIAAGLGGVA